MGSLATVVLTIGGIIGGAMIFLPAPRKPDAPPACGNFMFVALPLAGVGAIWFGVLGFTTGRSIHRKLMARVERRWRDELK